MNASIKNNKGFSLIETLVVCVIIAVLAAVSIPLYMGYLNNQRWTTVNNLAETAAAAANAQWRRTGADLTAGTVTPNDPTRLNLYFNAASYSVVIVAGGTLTVTDLIKSSVTKNISYH